MKNQKRIKSSIYYPIKLYNAIKKLSEKDSLNKSFNQKVLELLVSNEEVKKEMEKEN